MSLNVGYSGDPSSSGNTRPVFSNAFAYRRPDVKFDHSGQILNEGGAIPVAVASKHMNSAGSMIAHSLRHWQAGDTVGVCIDSDACTVEYTLNGLSLGEVSFAGFCAWEPWYPSASVQGGGVIFVFDQEDCMHAPPKSDC